MAWGRWQLHTDIERLTPSEFRLQPALSRRLDAHGINHPWQARLRGVHRYCWTANQLTRRDVMDVFGALRRAGVDAVEPGGVPFIARLYGDLAGRLAEHVEVLVLPDALPAADATLTAQGWRPRAPLPPPALRSVCGPLLYERADHRHVRLHWNSAPAPVTESVNRDIFSRRVEASTLTEWVPTLDDVDALILTCVHHRRLAPQDDLIWVADALALLQRIPPARHPLLYERAGALGVGGRFQRALAGIHALVGASLKTVPPPNTHTADDDPDVAIMLDVAEGPGGIGRAISRARARYAAWCASTGAPRSASGFVRFSVDVYKYDWNAPLWRLPVVAMRRLRANDAFLVHA